MKVTFADKFAQLAESLQKAEKHEKRVARRQREKARKASARPHSTHADERETQKIFYEGQGFRVRKRVKNTFSREEAGTCGTYVRTNRFNNSYTTIVTKSIKY